MICFYKGKEMLIECKKESKQFLKENDHREKYININFTFKLISESFQ